MKDQNKINFTNLANKKSKDPIYITIVIGVFLICIVLFLVFFTDIFKNKEPSVDLGTKTISDEGGKTITPTVEDIVTPTKEDLPIVTPTKEDNEELSQENNNLEETLSQIEKAKLSVFVANVQLLFNNAQIQYMSELQNGKNIDEISPQNNSIDTTLDYCIKLNNGIITKIQAQDALFSLEINDINNVSEISSKYVKKEKITSFDCK